MIAYCWINSWLIKKIQHNICHRVKSTEDKYEKSKQFRHPNSTSRTEIY